MNYSSTLLISLCLALVASGGCNLINPDEDAPAFIEVKEFTFDPTPTLQEMGPSSSTKIKDVWVYIDNKFQGAYELPARFPVLKSGRQKVILSPGIFLNGIASTRSPYPFYQSHIEEIDLVEKGTVVINPQTSYFTTVESSYIEAFEGAGFSLTSTNNSDTIMYQLPAGDPNIFEGNSSGVAYLDSVGRRLELTSTTDYDLPGAGAAVFLELDYKINQAMHIGLFINIPGQTQEQVPVYTLNPTDEWNKIYIQLGYTVSAYQALTKFKIYFYAEKDVTIGQSVFYIDNIKVVHF
jgi:hypothetical protein